MLNQYTYKKTLLIRSIDNLALMYERRYGFEKNTNSAIYWY